MLLLTRNIGQTIVINGDTTVTVMEVSSNGQVRLGVNAPREVRVDRQEIHDKRMAEQAEQAKPKSVLQKVKEVMLK